MKKRILILITVILIICYRTVSQQIDYKGFPEWTWHNEGDTEFYLYSPQDIQENERYPLAVHLHGCCGEDNHATLRNAVDPPARMWHNFGANTQLEPTFIMTPKTTRGWNQKFQDIINAIENLIADGKVDPQRIYMTGFSMGGVGTWQFLEQYPGFIAAAIPMGSGIRADLEKVKDTPAWAIRGEFDHFAQKLDSQVAVIRRLNGDFRGAFEWVTGVNPRFTSFKGLGHGIQWDAVSSLDLMKWAYAQINDGNISPVVFFKSPAYKQNFLKGSYAEVEINGFDSDGKIKRVTLTLNGEIVGTSKKLPFNILIEVKEGDNILVATAVDNKKKSTTAQLLIRTDIVPQITTSELPEGRAGTYYKSDLSATGNQPVKFFIPEGTSLPAGLRLEENSIIGIPEVPGKYQVEISVIDDNGQEIKEDFQLLIHKKPDNEVLVTGVHSVADSLINRVSKMKIGDLPNTQVGTEVSFSEIGKYEGLTFIATSNIQANLSGENALSFNVDEDVNVYVAYEKLDNLYQSTIPEWLNDFEYQDGDQIVAQYHYFDIYKKEFPAGEISLPGGQCNEHNVRRNYFVMVEKSR